MIVVGFSVLSSGGKVAADNSPGTPSWGCPSSPNDISPKWGIQNGGIGHNYASLTVFAHVAGNSSPNGLNVTYRLNSDVTRGYYYGPPPAGLKNTSLYPSARIFTYADTGEDGQIDVNGRTNQRQFRTGNPIGLPSGHCDGWDELGPGTTGYVGNGYVLDCEEYDVNNHVYRNNHFWIDQISTPAGEAGRYGGYWTVNVSSAGEASHDVPFPMNYDGNPDINRSNDLQVTNGDNARINLTWHPNSPPPPHPESNGRCEQLYVNGWGAYDTGASEPNGSPRWRDTQTYVRVTDGNGNVLVPQSGDTTSGDGQFAVLSGGPGPPGYNDSHTWNYKNGLRSGTVNVHIIRKWHHRNGTDYNWYTDPGQDNTNTYNCFSASCDLSMTGDVAGRGNGVESGSGFTVTAHVHNYGTPEGDDPLPATIGGRPLILSSTSSPVGFWYNPAAPSGLNSGGDEYNTWNVNEPGWGIGSYGVNATLYYDFDPAPGIQGGDLVIANCSPTSYDVYKQFHLDVSADIKLLDNSNNPTAEDPKKVIFDGYANGNVPDYPGGINVNYNATTTKTPYGGPGQILDNPSGATGHTNVVYSSQYNPPGSAAGDKYEINPFCVWQTDGWIGPSNQFSSDTYGSCANAHAYVYDEPYLHTYGADVVSGSNFRNGDTCDTTGNSQKISAFRSTDPAKSGSGAQFAALAMNQISGFGSASTRTSAPGWATGLSFANSVGIGGGAYDQPNDGGYFNGQATCTQDFYSTLDTSIAKTLPNASTSPLDLINRVNSQNSGKPTQFYRNGSLTIGGGNFTKQATVFVNGDVIINGNISYNPGSYLAIVAKGNIYIRNTVSRLDGLYVAQPSDATHGGTIYTCASGAVPIGTAALYTNCRTQLVVNGAFAAKDVKFLRVANSLRDSRPREVPNFTDGTGTKAAEIFNFSPEVYLFTPIYQQVTTGQAYQYITTLPPVL